MSLRVGGIAVCGGVVGGMFLMACTASPATVLGNGALGNGGAAGGTAGSVAGSMGGSGSAMNQGGAATNASGTGGAVATATGTAGGAMNGVGGGGSAGTTAGMAGAAAVGGTSAGGQVSGAAGTASAGATGMAGAAGAGPFVTECDASSAPAIGALGVETVFTSGDLVGVSAAVQPPNSDDWYLVEQRGRILVLSGGELRATPFLDVTDEVNVDPMYDERGLHSIAFAPDYETSGLFYLVMTASAGDRANRDLFLEYRRSEADPFVAETTATRELLNLEGLPTNGLFDNIHNAYQAKFGPDGMLYLGMGDGGGECNNNTGFEELPQDIASPYGKLLRFDLSQPEPWGAADNPFAGLGDGRVYHYGLRNPFRFSWDSATGDLYIGDVGQDTHEEINVALAGQVGLNFGWATWEGDEMVCNGRALREGADVTDPIYFTTHGSEGFGAAIVGGALYRGSAIPALQGTYLFGDWSADELTALYHCSGETSASTKIDYVADPNLPNNGYLVKVGENVPDLVNLTSIVEGHDSELYLTVNGDTLLKIVPAP